VTRWLAQFRVVVLAFTAAFVLVVVSRTSISGETLNEHPKGPTQALWVKSGAMYSVLEGGALTHSGVARPKLVFGNPAGSPGGLTFDRDGNLWGSLVGGLVPSFIFKLTPKQIQRLAHREKVKPAVVMDNDGGFPIRFDSAGNLWVATPPPYGAYLEMYTPDQLVSEPAPIPARHFTFDDTIGVITDFAFDGTGNLWVDSDYGANPTGQTGLSEFVPDQIGASAASLTPHLQLPEAAGKALAFDSSGDLWAATEIAIYMFRPSQLTGFGFQSPIPAVTINGVPVGRGGSFLDPEGLAFDAQGNLWVASATDVGGLNYGGISEIGANDLKSGGSPQPLVVLRANRRRTNLDGPSLMAFGPRL
jgi:hypothetical protein